MHVYARHTFLAVVDVPSTPFYTLTVQDDTEQLVQGLGTRGTNNFSLSIRRETKKIVNPLRARSWWFPWVLVFLPSRPPASYSVTLLSHSW